VHRIPENGGPTTRGLERLDAWLGEEKWDIIHFNFGLHDLKFLDDGTQQVPPAMYEQNLEAIVRRLKKTRATLIWASTTPVPPGCTSPLRRPEDAAAYNAVAARVMDKHKIRTNDLYGFALPQLGDIQSPANVHFTPHGSQVLAGQVAAEIETALSKRK
jgi:acyl-CoA thioesterase-1